MLYLYARMNRDGKQIPAYSELLYGVSRAADDSYLFVVVFSARSE